MSDGYEKANRVLEYRRQYDQRRKEAGLCVRCGKPIEPERREKGRGRCGECSKAQVIRQQASAHQRREAHLCTRCGAQLPETDTHQTCRTCRLIAARYMHERKLERIHTHDCE